MSKVAVWTLVTTGALLVPGPTPLYLTPPLYEARRLMMRRSYIPITVLHCYDASNLWVELEGREWLAGTVIMLHGPMSGFGSSASPFSEPKRAVYTLSVIFAGYLVLPYVPNLRRPNLLDIMVTSWWIMGYTVAEYLIFKYVLLEPGATDKQLTSAETDIDEAYNSN